MKSGERKPTVRREYETCQIATVFSLLGWLASGAQAIVFIVSSLVSIFAFEMMRHSLIGMILSVVATVSGISVMIMGIFARSKDRKLALACTVLSVFSSTLVLCCINHPYVGYFYVYVLPATFSGVFNLIATVLYANFWAKAPRSAEKLHVNNEQDLHADTDSFSGESVDRNSKYKKKFAITLLVSFLAFGIIVSAVIPTEYSKNCNIVYNRMVYEMADKNHGVSFKIRLDSYLNNLPDGYRDTDKIKEQYKIYNELFDEYELSQTGEEARNAVEKMCELKKIDDRWNFGGDYKQTILYCDAVWQCGDYSLTLGQESDIEAIQEFSTSFPYSRPEYAEEMGEITVVGTYRYYSGNHHYVRSYEWILGYNLRYEYDGEVREFSKDICRIDSISYSVEDEAFVLRVYCYKTSKYYDMKLA